MKGLLTRSSERKIVEDFGNDFLQDLKLTIKEFCEREECESEVNHAIIYDEYIAASLASNLDKIASFEVEAFVDNIVVFSYIGLAS